MPPSTRLPTLHLYRHLLREASYLPRSCTNYIRTQITTRFHKHAKDSPSPLTIRRLRTAHSNLRTLRAANAGQVLIMEHILHLAHGRTGRRRRLLIAQLLHPSTSSPAAAAAAATASARPPPPQPHHPATALPRALPPAPEPDWLDTWDLPALHALAASQAAHAFTSPAPALTRSNSLAPTEADVPALSTWGKPLGPRLARRKLRKWYRSIVRRVMPPVPRAEWEMLRVLAGGGGAWRVPARRAAARAGVAALRAGEAEARGGAQARRRWDWQLYATAPVRSLERGQSRSMKARTGEEGPAPYGLGVATGLHRYDRRRLWQRLYMKVWEATPVMEERIGDDGERKWKITWGGQRKVVQMARKDQLAFFEGVSEAMMTRTARSRKKRW